MTTADPAAARPVDGSFRDPEARVFVEDGAVLRALSGRALAEWQAVCSTRFMESALAEGRVVATELETDGLSAELELPTGEAVEGVLRHERLPFVSYPYEWTFSMLRDAALLELDLLAAALAEGFVLKDGTPYNVQWRGSRPVFVDVASLERLGEGEPWAGYRQFCSLFLFPLMIQAYRGLPFQPWLRGALEGIEPAQARSVLRGRDLLRRGVLTHVVLHSRLERRHAGDDDARAQLKRAGFRRELVEANAKRLRRLVERLRWSPGDTAWSEYGASAPYERADLARKEGFVRDVVESSRPRLVWDLGCNDGRFSRIAAQRADCVVAIDSDAGVVERLYRRVREEGDERILPLLVDLADPSPNRGWRGRERLSLERRGTPEVVLCLALVHHLSLSSNIPFSELLDWLHGLGAAIVIEFADRDDPMVRRLLARKPESANRHYRSDAFERELRARFDVRRSLTLESGTRTLHLAVPRPA